MRKRIIDYWKWIFGCILIPLSLKSIFWGGFTVWAITLAPIRLGIDVSIKDAIVPTCYTLSSLLILLSSIGLLMTKNWARKLIFIVFPVYFIFSVILYYYYVHEGDLIKSLYWNSLIPFFYVVLIYFFTKAKIKEQF